MANYKARSPEELAKILGIIKKKNDRMVKELSGTNLGRMAMQGGLIIEARAKEILTEKGHVVTGTLRRSINTQLTATDAFSAVVEVGTFIVYGPFIENLPDGGFLFPAAVETFPIVSRFLNERGVVPVLKQWGQ